jgi:hypothetical protein
MSRVRLATPTEVAVPALATLQEQRYRLAYAPTAGSPDSGRDQTRCCRVGGSAVMIGWTPGLVMKLVPATAICGHF